MAKKESAKASSKPRRVSYDGAMSAGEAADYLEGLAQGLREGELTISEGSRVMRATIDGEVELEVEARHGKRRSRIQLALAFRTPKEAAQPGPEPSSVAETPAATIQPEATIPDEMSF